MSYHWQTKSFQALGNDELYRILRLRQEVFVIEQQCFYQDLDGKDQQATHILCWLGTELMAYQRCLPPGTSYRESSMGRIVVASAARGSGLGRELVARGISHNEEQWPASDIRINAQSYLEDFYTELGFATQGDAYDEDGIMHVQMLYLAQGE